MNEVMFISDQCYDPGSWFDQFWDTALKEDLDNWWLRGVEGNDYLKFYCCL